MHIIFFFFTFAKTQIQYYTKHVAFLNHSKIHYWVYSRIFIPCFIQLLIKLQKTLWRMAECILRQPCTDSHCSTFPRHLTQWLLTRDLTLPRLYPVPSAQYLPSTYHPPPVLYKLKNHRTSIPFYPTTAGLRINSTPTLPWTDRCPKGTPSINSTSDVFGHENYLHYSEEASECSGTFSKFKLAICFTEIQM